MNMSLTQEQQLEMFADIKVIKNNCIGCKQQMTELEKRVKFLEQGYWKFVGVASVVLFIAHKLF